MIQVMPWELLTVGMVVFIAGIIIGAITFRPREEDELRKHIAFKKHVERMAIERYTKRLNLALRRSVHNIMEDELNGKPMPKPLVSSSVKHIITKPRRD